MLRISHILCLLEGCNKNILDNKDRIISILKESASKGNMNIMKISFVKFRPNGLSVIITISESHIAIHTWPEIGKADLEIVSCGKKSKQFDTLNFILKNIKPKKITKKVINFYI